MTLCKLHKMG